MLEWQLFVPNAFVRCYSSAPSLKMDTKNTTACQVPLMERKAGGHGSQRAPFPVSLRSIQLTCFPVSLRIGGQLARLPVSLRTGMRSHASRLVKVKQLSARHLL